MDNHEIAKALADIIDLRVTEHVRGDRLVWLIGGKQEWNPVEKIEQLWPFLERCVLETTYTTERDWDNRPAFWEANCRVIETSERGSGFGFTLRQAVVSAIADAYFPSRAGR